VRVGSGVPSSDAVQPLGHNRVHSRLRNRQSVSVEVEKEEEEEEIYNMRTSNLRVQRDLSCFLIFMSLSP